MTLFCFYSILDLYLLSLIVMTGITVYFVIDPPWWIVTFLELDLEGVDMFFRGLMVIIALAHAVLALLCEVIFVDFYKKN